MQNVNKVLKVKRFKAFIDLPKIVELQEIRDLELRVRSQKLNYAGNN